MDDNKSFIGDTSHSKISSSNQHQQSSHTVFNHSDQFMKPTVHKKPPQKTVAFFGDSDEEESQTKSFIQ